MRLILAHAKLGLVAELHSPPASMVTPALARTCKHKGIPRDGSVGSGDGSAVDCADKPTIDEAEAGAMQAFFATLLRTAEGEGESDTSRSPSMRGAEQGRAVQAGAMRDRAECEPSERQPQDVLRRVQSLPTCTPTPCTQQCSAFEAVSPAMCASNEAVIRGETPLAESASTTISTTGSSAGGHAATEGKRVGAGEAAGAVGINACGDRTESPVSSSRVRAAAVSAEPVSAGGPTTRFEGGDAPEVERGVRVAADTLLLRWPRAAPASVPAGTARSVSAATSYPFTSSDEQGGAYRRGAKAEWQAKLPPSPLTPSPITPSPITPFHARLEKRRSSDARNQSQVASTQPPCARPCPRPCPRPCVGSL
eukprot:772019-Pleurochrysis_carterae.AAC.4